MYRGDFSPPFNYSAIGSLTIRASVPLLFNTFNVIVVSKIICYRTLLL